MAKKKQRLNVVAADNYRVLTEFINEQNIEKEDILKIDIKDSQIFLLYYSKEN